MTTILNVFGINWMTLAFYLVNFAVIFFILYKLGYKSILGFVNERTAQIEKGLKDAEEAAAALTTAQAEQERVLADARREASVILEEARERGDAHLAEVKNQAQAEIEKMIDAAKEAMAADREKMMREVREEAVQIVLVATEKLLGEKVDTAKDKQFVESVMDKA